MALNQTTTAYGFLLSEAPGELSRENITTASTGLVPGSVVVNPAGVGSWVVIPNSDLAANTIVAIVNGPADTGLVATTRRNAEVIGSQLVWPGALTGGRKTAALAILAAQNVIVR